jgi:Flp pilus assembly pilin Flp
MPSQKAEREMSNNVTLRSTIAVVRDFLVADERGATAIEYAMIAAGIGATIAATVFTLGTELKTNFYDRIAALF